MGAAVIPNHFVFMRGFMIFGEPMICMVNLMISFSIWADMCFYQFTLCCIGYFCFARITEKALILRLVRAWSPFSAISAAAAFDKRHVYE